jgi:hypothetical protein
MAQPPGKHLAIHAGQLAVEPCLAKHEHHPNAAEKGETANIKQNTTNKGFFHGRRFDK